MNTFTYPPGSIVELIGHDSPHCGVTLDEHRTVELMAFRDDSLQKMCCKLIMIDLRQAESHPITGKPPFYKLRQQPTFPWTTIQLKEKINKLKSKYEGKEYHIIKKNCQHFAWELATGQKKSPDADKFRAIGGLIGFAMKVKDFGSSGASAGLVDIEPLQQNLWVYLQM